jgi:hypothetical protein
MIIFAILGGIPTGIIVGLSSDTPTTKLIVVAIIIGVFFLGWPLGAVSALSDEVDNRVALYPAGVAQLRRDEPEPVVLRWVDVETVMIELTTDEGTPLTDLASCTLGGRSGIQVAEKKNARAVMAATHRTLGPRLVPTLLAACDRGEPVSAGDARVDPDGFTVPRGQRLAWSEIKSVTMQHARKGPEEVATRIDVRTVRRNRLHYFDPTGVPNAIFFAHVLARAATRNGVQVDGYPGGLAVSAGELEARRTARPADDRKLALLFGAGVRRSTVSNRLFRYSDGLAQLVRDEPEPRVARWADVRDFTVFYFEADDAPPRLTGFLVTTEAGTSLPGLRGYRNRRELRTLVAEAEKHLAPRLVPAMTEAYESGAAVAFGRVVVGGEGITVSASTAPGELIEWSQVKSVHLTYIGSRDGDYVDQVIVGRRACRPRRSASPACRTGSSCPNCSHTWPAGKA